MRAAANLHSCSSYTELSSHDKQHIIWPIDVSSSFVQHWKVLLHNDAIQSRDKDKTVVTGDAKAKRKSCQMVKIMKDPLFWHCSCMVGMPIIPCHFLLLICFIIAA
jgi:hypothetical protein